MSLPPLDGYTLWLLPDEKSASKLGQPIEEISTIFDSYPFYPHITIGRVPYSDPVRLSSLLPSIATGIKPLTITLHSVECRDNPYQKLIFTIKNKLQFTLAADAIDRIFEGDFGKRRDHHISVLYANISCEEFKEDKVNLKCYLSKSFLFNKIALVCLKGSPDKWRIVKACELQTA
ncbi:MAG: hypothetical protein EA391_08000 [Balneolaceae bacterium]|nr:MAG: hypothetical protein EA391_08000 [Balneolaceae bacterium]